MVAFLLLNLFVLFITAMCSVYMWGAQGQWYPMEVKEPLCGVGLFLHRSLGPRDGTQTIRSARFSSLSHLTADLKVQGQTPHLFGFGLIFWPVVRNYKLVLEKPSTAAVVHARGVPATGGGGWGGGYGRRIV